MSVQSTIENKLSTALDPQFMQVLNESHMHSVPENSETHFKLVLVSAAFEGKRSVARHQMVYKLLADELAGPVHALALHTYTNSEWQHDKTVPASPNCMGANKA